MVSLETSPSFLSKNQLGKEGPDSGAPVVIPALRTNQSRLIDPYAQLEPCATIWIGIHSEIIVFVSFKKGFNKNISPATISLWIKQTVILRL